MDLPTQLVNKGILSVTESVMAACQFVVYKCNKFVVNRVVRQTGQCFWLYNQGRDRHLRVLSRFSNSDQLRDWGWTVYVSSRALEGVIEEADHWTEIFQMPRKHVFLKMMTLLQEISHHISMATDKPRQKMDPSGQLREQLVRPHIWDFGHFRLWYLYAGGIMTFSLCNGPPVSQG